MPLEIFRDLELQGEHDNLTRLIEHLGENPAGNWRREQETETRSSRHAPGQDGPFCFSFRSDPPSLIAGLWLYFKRPDLLQVTNIVPWGEVNQLTHEQYNEIAADFYHSMLVPVIDRFGVRATLTGSQVDIDDYVSERCAAALRRFSGAANRSTGTGHPLDHQRWIEFVLLAHADGVALEAPILARWFHESEGWSEEKASSLAAEYEDARILLRSYDEFRARNA